MSSLTEISSSYHDRLNNDLGALHAANQRLTERGARFDMPTGTTPQKKTWDYVDQWDLTYSRETLLRKSSGRSSVSTSGAEVTERIFLTKDEFDDSWETEELTQKPLNKITVPRTSTLTSRSPTPSYSSGSTMVTPQDSPESQVSSVAPSIPKSIAEPIRPLTKTTSSLRVPTAPLVDSRRKNVVANRPSRRFVR